MSIPSKKQCTNWLKSRYDYKSTNISGCPFWGEPGFPDGHALGVGFIETKRGNEQFKPGQVEWIKRVNGFCYRFWGTYVEVYDKDLILVDRMEYEEI